MAKITGGRFIAEFLNAQGVTAFFFVPTMLSRALAEMDNMPIKRVLTHGEKAAAYMADGYARASGRPGICAAQAVGAANLAAGLRDAYMGHSPVIALTGGRWGHQKHKINYQEMDDFPMLTQVTKANFQADSVGRIPDLLRQAFREATSGTPAPVNILFAGKEGDIEHDEAELKLIPEPGFTHVPSYRPAPEAARVAEAARILKDAQKPVIVVGGGARLSGAGAEVLKLAEALSIPIATSLNGFSLVPDNHPLYIGVPGTYSRSCTNKILSRADLVLYIGSQTAGQVTHFWKIPAAGTPVIQIGIDPSDLGRNYPNRVSILGDAKTALQMLNQVVAADGNKGGRNAKWLEETSAAVSTWRAEVKPLRESSAEPMRPERLMKELGDWLPQDTIVVCDTGHAGMWSAQQFWVTKPWDFIRAAGSLGWAFPASIGAKVAMPKKPVVCFTGDGGFWYHLQELETAVRCNIPVVTVVNNNNALNQETLIFKQAYGGNPSPKNTEMWHFSEVNFASIAENMGALGIRVTKPSELRSALDRALSSGRPAVVEVISDIEALAPNPWEG
ncbi:MAG TPA: thiamine pyrophosphate-binding protein [Candidatus Saccharimonadales bacterium]|nr:thiamine pyrophosphate-binding protein [Candidatus Saccharimonadales bacterium]